MVDPGKRESDKGWRMSIRGKRYGKRTRRQHLLPQLCCSRGRWSIGMFQVADRDLALHGGVDANQ